MTIALNHHFSSGSSQTGGDKTYTRQWRVSGENDLATATTDFEAAVAATYGGLDLDNVSVEFYADDGTNVTWMGTATYKKRPRAIFDPEGLDNFYSFDSTGGGEHITHSLSTSQVRNAAGHAAQDHKNAINVANGMVGGVDIGLPSYDWTETHYIADDDMTDDYIELIAGASWLVNSDTFKLRKGGSQDLPAGSVIFRGATGSQRDEGDWELTFNFSFSPNVTNRTIGDITGINKLGWEFLWITTEGDTSGGAPVQKAVQSNVEKVYETTTFSSLGIR